MIIVCCKTGLISWFIMCNTVQWNTSLRTALNFVQPLYKGHPFWSQINTVLVACTPL